MTPQLTTENNSGPRATTRPHELPNLPYRALTPRELILWGAVAVISFHVACEYCPPVIVLFLVSMYRLAHARTRPHAMYAGWILGLLIYGPQLSFFWGIFGAAAIALWLVLATWLSAFLVLQRFAILKLRPHFAALAAPFLWTGLEYFRSELYYLRFSWLSIGYTFAEFPRAAFIPWLGTYGLGFVLMLVAAQWPFHNGISPGKRWTWLIGLAVLVAAASLTESSAKTRISGVSELKIAGVQLEFPDETTVVAELDKLLASSPQTQLFVLSEYTFMGPVPRKVREWCAWHGKYLVAGGKDFTDPSEKQFRNTAFVIGPNGETVFSQVKGVPIQFFNDGLAATEENVWNSPWGKLGLCVCYDLSYTRITDELIDKGAQAIIAPTMDVEEWGERQHRLHARVAPVRAAEYRVPIFRLCSSGISQAVDARGRVLAIAPFPGQRNTLEATLKLPPHGTRPLDRLLVWPCVAVCGAFLLWHMLHAFSNRRRFGAP